MSQNEDGICEQKIVGTGKYCMILVRIAIIEQMQNMDWDPFLDETLGYLLASDKIYAKSKHIVWICAAR